MNRRRLFGTNGVRGIPGRDLTIQFLLDLGGAIGTYFKEGSILVGYDGRNTGEAIAKTVGSALMASGVDVVEAGMLPTPALQCSVSHLGYRGGVMITASHNPPEYNGVKVVGSNGVEVSREDEVKIEAIYFSSRQKRANWASVGSSNRELRANDEYVNSIVRRINAELVKSAGLSAVLDLGNGVQALTAPYVLEKLGCRCLSINSHVDGGFPGRGAEPTPEILGELSETVQTFDADLGVAFDGDGDRSIFADEKGKVYWGDRSGCLIASHVLSRSSKATVVTTVSTSQLVDFVAGERKAKVVRTRVGSVDVSSAMIRLKAVFGLEENGGCFYGPHLPVRDGAMSMALMLELLASEERGLSQLFAQLPNYFQRKEKFQCSSDRAGDLLQRISTIAEGKVDRTDGVKIYTDSSTWILIRPSGTEPAIRVFAESDNEAKLNRVWNKFTKLVKEFLSQDKIHAK